MFNNVDANIPLITAIAKGENLSAPSANSNPKGSIPVISDNAVIIIGLYLAFTASTRLFSKIVSIFNE